MGFWMLPRARSFVVLMSVLALLAGVGLLLYAHWSKPLIQASRAAEVRDVEGALGAYATGASRFRDVVLSQRAFHDDFAWLTYNRLALLYRTGRYDAVLEAADGAPPGAAPHFWMGCALFAKSAQEKKPEARLEWLSRAEDEFKLALAAAPDDWDTKYNYELAGRLGVVLRKKPEAVPPSMMQLLRPSKEGPQREPPKKTG
jgi:hypothetical protein